jgi:hypothetical protein
MTSVIVAEDPEARLGIRQVIVSAERVHLPALEFTEMNDALAGIVSVRTIPVASDELLFRRVVV